MTRGTFMKLVVVAVLGLAMLSGGQSEKISERVLYNAKVFTGEPELPYAEAVAIRGDKIEAVGVNSDAFKAVGMNAEKIDLQGKTLLPGLIDSHTHLMDSAPILIGADVGDKVHTLDDLVA